MQDKIQKHLKRHPTLIKEYVIEEYVNKKRSMDSLCKEHKIGPNLLKDLFDFHGIVQRTVAENAYSTLEEKIKSILQVFPFANIKFIETEYIVNQKSLPDLQKEYGLNSDHVIKLLKYYNLPRRSISEASKTKVFKQKLKNTLTKKYGQGVENISQIDFVKKKKRNNCLSTLGVDNFFKQKNIKEVIERGFQNNYGCSISEYRRKKSKEVWAFLTEEEKTSWLEKSIQSDFAQSKQVGYRTSKGEETLSEILSELQITHTRQLQLKYEEVNKKRRFFYDIYIPKLNLIIEFNGDYWHANPDLYKASDLIHYRFGDITAEEIWNKDLKKKKLAESAGYSIITVWEKEIKKLSNKEILNLIQTKIYEVAKN
jgi:very-short-patch-repair endonuclease